METFKPDWTMLDNVVKRANETLGDDEVAMEVSDRIYILNQLFDWVHWRSIC